MFLFLFFIEVACSSLNDPNCEKVVLDFKLINDFWLSIN